MLTIAEADINDDRSLLTITELRAAAGVADDSLDATLTPLGNYISASITAACKVAKAGATPATLRLETVTETFLFKSLQKSLVLARRPVVEIISVTENSSVLSTDDYAIDGASGILYRSSITGCYPRGPYGCWPCGNTVVEFTAGYDDVPSDLKYAAIKFVKAELVTGSRDPLLKSIRIEGVSQRDYWVDPNRSSIIPGEVMNILVSGGYVDMVVA